MVVPVRCLTLILLLTCCLVSTQNSQLRIAAFNIQIFGVTKMNNAPVIDCIGKTLSRYDVVLIQEIRDVDTTTNSSIYRLLNKLNSLGLGNWNISLSERLGRTPSREQYAYFYKVGRVRVVKTHQWPDDRGVFERPPFIARFRSDSYEFGFIGIHTKPEEAVYEIDNLTDVYDQMKTNWNLEDFLIGGDLNAGGNYVRKSQWSSIRLWTDERFLWTTDNNVYTTTKTNYPYDRLVLAGRTLRSRLVNGSAMAYKYDDLANCKSLAVNISDHFPIELLLDNIVSSASRSHCTITWLSIVLVALWLSVCHSYKDCRWLEQLT